VVLLAPLFERISGNEHVRDFIRGVTAIATGAIAAAILLLSKSAIVDVPTVIILLVSAVLLFKFKLPEPALIGLAAIAGLVIRGV
jgi:chromate transporter